MHAERVRQTLGPELLVRLEHGAPVLGTRLANLLRVLRPAHEHTHGTGHASRLGRINRAAAFGSPDYAREELVAELGAGELVAA